MPATSTEPTTAAIPEALCQKIATLSENDADLMAMERRRAEESLAFRHGQRIWHQLSPQERDQLRSAVGEFQPDWDPERHASLVEHHCIDYITEVLADAGGENAAA